MPGAGSSTPRVAGEHRWFPQITPSGSQNWEDRQQGRALKGGLGKQGQGQQLPKEKPPALGQRRCSDTTTPPQSHMSCLDPPCPLSVPSHYSQEQEHPPSTLQNRTPNTPPRLRRVTHFRLIRHRLIFPPVTCVRLRLEPEPGFDSRDTQGARGATDKSSPRPQQPGLGSSISPKPHPSSPRSRAGDRHWARDFTSSALCHPAKQAQHQTHAARIHPFPFLI